MFKENLPRYINLSIVSIVIIFVAYLFSSEDVPRYAMELLRALLVIESIQVFRQNKKAYRTVLALSAVATIGIGLVIHFSEHIIQYSSDWWKMQTVNYMILASEFAAALLFRGATKDWEAKYKQLHKYVGFYRKQTQSVSSDLESKKREMTAKLSYIRKLEKSQEEKAEKVRVEAEANLKEVEAKLSAVEEKLKGVEAGKDGFKELLEEVENRLKKAEAERKKAEEGRLLVETKLKKAEEDLSEVKASRDQLEGLLKGTQVKLNDTEGKLKSMNGTLELGRKLAGKFISLPGNVYALSCGCGSFSPVGRTANPAKCPGCGSEHHRTDANTITKVNIK